MWTTEMAVEERDEILIPWGWARYGCDPTEDKSAGVLSMLISLQQNLYGTKKE